MKASIRIRVVTLAVALTVGGLVTPARTLSTTAADDVMARMRQMYGDLRSYADTGTVIWEYGSGSTDRYTFTTWFTRVPRQFLLDFRRSQDQYVIWGDPDAFHTWWKTTSGQYDYPNPNNVTAISGSSRNTTGTALKIPTLLYAKAALGGDFTGMTAPVVDGVEDVSGHRCHRLRQSVSDTYAATGKETNARELTVWIDTDSLLIRKVLEEWKPLPGQRSRIITLYEPQANPTIAAAKFRFVPPVK